MRGGGATAVRRCNGRQDDRSGAGWQKRGHWRNHKKAVPFVGRLLVHVRLYGGWEGGWAYGLRRKNLNIFAKLDVFNDGVQDNQGGSLSSTGIPPPPHPHTLEKNVMVDGNN